MSPLPTSMPQRPWLIAPLQSTTSGSRAFLAIASDGQRYWVKPQNNPQGVRTLAAEVVVHGIGELIGAPVRSTTLLQIPADLDWAYAPGLRLQQGVAHGSLDLDPVVVSDDWRTFAGHDHNRDRQAYVLGLWDLCMGGDAQWLHDLSDDYAIWTFDHGFWLGGDGHWDADSLRKIGTSPWQYDLDLDVASASALSSAAQAIRGLDRDAISAVVESVPVEWPIPRNDLSVLADVLYLRTEGVADRLDAAAAASHY